MHAAFMLFCTYSTHSRHLHSSEIRNSFYLLWVDCCSNIYLTNLIEWRIWLVGAQSWIRITDLQAVEINHLVQPDSRTARNSGNSGKLVLCLPMLQFQPEVLSKTAVLAPQSASLPVFAPLLSCEVSGSAVHLLFLLKSLLTLKGSLWHLKSL